MGLFRRGVPVSSPALSIITGVSLAGLLGQAEHELTPEERARREATRAAYEAERCPCCGCHPDEHGAY